LLKKLNAPRLAYTAPLAMPFSTYLRRRVCGCNYHHADLSARLIFDDSDNRVNHFGSFCVRKMARSIQDKIFISGENLVWPYKTGNRKRTMYEIRISQGQCEYV
jgi:hypothetical protein